jgi:uncharacterized protein
MSVAQITVQVLKYDGTEYRRWQARLSCCSGSLMVFDAEFEVDVEHELLGQIRGGTRTIEYYWLGRWYNIFRFLSEDGGTRLFYCNVNMPPKLEGDRLTYVDLDIDMLVQPDLSYEVLDLDEFEINAVRYGYPPQVREQAQEAVNELTSMITSRQFPFDFASASVNAS